MFPNFTLNGLVQQIVYQRFPFKNFASSRGIVSFFLFEENEKKVGTASSFNIRFRLVPVNSAFIIKKEEKKKLVNYPRPKKKVIVFEKLT